MTLGFAGDAITLSGLTGTKLKCNVLGIYYPFWWKITSGGPIRNYAFPTTIVELDAATGEVHIEDTGETVLGSAGHALELKVAKAPNTRNLKVVLVEKHPECYSHLTNVIERRWPDLSVSEAEGPIASNSSNVFLLNKTLDEALETIGNLNLGNAIFFFDPLKSVKYTAIEKVARRITSFYRTGTEFIVFVFTSDWFLGRDDSAPLPCTCEENSWNSAEKDTVSEADSLFGDTEWRAHILNKSSIADKERTLVKLYRHRLHKWFRYVLPMPFNPKEDQIFHVILCSNYEVGVRATRDFYCEKTSNPKYSPSNTRAFAKFRSLYPKIFVGLKGNRRPLQWKILWRVIREHEEGICDFKCSDLKGIETSAIQRISVLKWLEQKGYLVPLNIGNSWGFPIEQYKLNWSLLKSNLGVSPPLPLIPISPEDI